MSHDKPHRLRPALLERARDFRRPLTAMEQRLWNHLRDRRCGYKFRRQAVLDRFIADFYCAEAKLVVEVDGSSHDGTVERDAVRDEWLTLHGYRTLRVTNADVRDKLERVLTVIEQACARRKENKNAPPPNLGNGE